MPEQDIYSGDGGNTQNLNGYSYAYGSPLPGTGAIGDRTAPSLAAISGAYKTRFDDYSYYTTGTL